MCFTFEKKGGGDGLFQDFAIKQIRNFMAFIIILRIKRCFQHAPEFTKCNRLLKQTSPSQPTSNLKVTESTIRGYSIDI